jgi:hypothetical protein
MLLLSPRQCLTQESHHVAGNTQSVRIGLFTIKTPSEWTDFSPGESATLQQFYIDQSKQVYQKFSKSTVDPSRLISIAAFHIEGNNGSFIAASFTVPPQSDLISLLKTQAKEKVDWGLRQGFIREYLGLVPVNDDQLSGFYIKTIGKTGNVEISGGLEHKMLKNTIIQLTLLSPHSWDQVAATNTLADILKSVTLVRK